MDETDQPQGPAEILFILSALAREKYRSGQLPQNSAAGLTKGLITREISIGLPKSLPVMWRSCSGQWRSLNYRPD